MPVAPSRGKLYLTLLAAFLGLQGAELVWASAQSPSHNLGRVLAGFGALQMGTLVEKLGGSYERAGATIVLACFAGMIAIWFGPETRSQPLSA